MNRRSEAEDSRRLVIRQPLAEFVSGGAPVPPARFQELQNQQLLQFGEIREAASVRRRGDICQIHSGQSFRRPILLHELPPQFFIRFRKTEKNVDSARSADGGVKLVRFQIAGEEVDHTNQTVAVLERIEQKFGDGSAQIIAMAIG